MLTYDFSGRVAVITGAGGGMGLEIANGILGAGGAAILIDVKDRPDALTDAPGRCLYVQGDLTDDRFVAGTIAAGAEQFGRIDYLANVAGVLWFGRDVSALEIDLALWDEVFDINLKSMVRTARATVPHMKAAGGGAMVHISSTQCLRGDPRPQDAYSASKAGVGALSRSLAMQLAGDGIRSNAIYPGLTLTPLQARWDTEEKRREAGSFVPLGRVGSAAELAAAALFLLSDGASYITGADLVVDGGLLLH